MAESLAPAQIKLRTLELFAELATLPKGSAEWVKIRNEIAVLNDGLARRVANKKSHLTNYPLDALLQLARIGLLNAISKYDPATGNAFSSLAVPFINGEILHFLRDYETPIKFRALRERADRVRSIQRKLIRTTGQPVSLEMIALYHEGMEPKEWAEVERLTSSKHMKSLDELGSDGEPIILTAPTSSTLEEREQHELQQLHLLKIMGGLSDAQQAILIAHYWQGKTPAEIGGEYGITEVEAEDALCRSVQILREKICSPSE